LDVERASCRFVQVFRQVVTKLCIGDVTSHRLTSVSHNRSFEMQSCLCLAESHPSWRRSFIIRIVSASDEIREASFHLPEDAHAEPEHDRGDADAEREAGPVKLARAEDAPAEAVDDADHRVERIEEPPFLR